MRGWAKAMFIGIAVVVMPLSSSAAQVEPRSTVEGTLEYALRLLAAKDYVKFMQELNSPESLRNLVGNKSVELVVERQQKLGAFDRLERLIKAATRTTPTLAASGRVVYFEFEPPVEGQKRFALQKAGRFWYLI